MPIQFINAVLFVKDIQVSRRFYEELLEQEVKMDLGLNVEYAGGFSLWQRDHACQVIFGGVVEKAPARNTTLELYFEPADLDETCRKLDAASVAWINPLQEQPWGSYSARLFDPDGTILELSEPMRVTVLRMIEAGWTVEAVAKKTAMPIQAVRKIVEE